MVRTPSNDRPSAHDGVLAGATAERGDDAKPALSAAFRFERPQHDRLRDARATGTRFARQQIAHPRGGMTGPKNRVPEMLRLLHRLALAIVTVIVCACIASPARGSSSLLVTAISVAARDSANAEQDALALESSHHWRDGASRPEVDLKAVESDGDNDDDDPLWHVSDDPALAFRCVPAPRQPDRALRGELQIATSRFAAGTGFPRGPPN